MININRNKDLFAAQTMRQINILEMKLFRSLKPILRKTFVETANLVQHGDVLNIVPTVIKRFSEDNRKALRKQYNVVGSIIYKQVTDRLQEIKPKKIQDYYFKDSFNNFWYFFNTWVNQQVASKVTRIDLTTMNVLRYIIDKGVKENKSYKDISKDILALEQITNKNRALMIAITETHGSFNFAQQKSVETSDVKIETKEWLNAGDERVRESPFNHKNAQGEKVKMDEPFIMTGQSLMFPGDPAGSAANVIRCRCVQLFNTEVQEITIEED